MLLDNVGNILSLLGTITGLLLCTSKYIKSPKRGYLYIIAFFLSGFFSDYYWTVYTQITHSIPEISEITAHFGWNLGYVCLFLAVLYFKDKKAKGFNSSVIVIQILLNVVQFFVNAHFTGVLNSLWAAAWTTATTVMCIQDIKYYIDNQNHFLDRKASFPYFSLLVLLFLNFAYFSRTTTCFYVYHNMPDFRVYNALTSYIIIAFFAWAAEKHYDFVEPEEYVKTEHEKKTDKKIQIITSGIILIGCFTGYVISAGIRNTLQADVTDTGVSDLISTVLFITALVLIFLVILLLYDVTTKYNAEKRLKQDIELVRSGRFNLIFTIVITLGLFVFSVSYNIKTLYKTSISEVYEQGVDTAVRTAVDLEKYLVTAKTTLRVVSDTVSVTAKHGVANKDIQKYLIDETRSAANIFDSTFTGIYGYVNGEFVSGTGWIPPKDYDPKTRPWYEMAARVDDEIVIVPPYLDAHTGCTVITFARSIPNLNESNSVDSRVVVCLDISVEHMQDLAESVSIAGKGYGMVVDTNGIIITHKNHQYNCMSVYEIYGNEFFSKILEAGHGNFTTLINGERCTVFVKPILETWYAVMIVNTTELFEKTYIHVAFNIAVTLISFLLISYFYYLGYKKERNYGKRVEDMNIHTISALAAAVDAKDPYTNGHSARVAKYTRMIAEKAGYNEEKLDDIYMMALLHDVGKIGVPDYVINKTDRLTDEEFAAIKKHPVIGSNILGSIKDRPNLAVGARWHHERFDGEGYPDGIAGDRIPEEARIIAVADSYDAMTSRRSYRDVMPQQTVLEEMEKGKSTQFDPHFADIMIQIIREDADYKLRED